MKGHVTLTTDELHLIQAIIRKGPVFSGLEQFALSEGRIPGEIERQSLLEKEILRPNNGRFSIDPAAGYAFTALADSTAYLQGGIIWNDDRVMRVNIYVTGTAFTVASFKNAEELDFLFIPTIQLLIGYLCSLIRKQRSSHAETSLTLDALTPEEVRKAFSELPGAEAGGAGSDCRLFFESCGTQTGWKGSRYVIAVDREGEMMYSEPSKGDSTYRKVSLAEALAPMNRKILDIHTSKIIDSGELNESEYRTNINPGKE